MGQETKNTRQRFVGAFNIGGGGFARLLCEYRCLSVIEALEYGGTLRQLTAANPVGRTSFNAFS